MLLMCNFFLFLFYLKEMLVLSFQVNIEINISRLPIKLDIPLKKRGVYVIHFKTLILFYGM